MKHRFALILFIAALVGFAASAQINVVPCPRNVEDMHTSFKINKNPKFYIDPAFGISQEYITSRLTDKGISPVFVNSPQKSTISIVSDANAIGHDEGYSLNVEKGKINATADDRNGALYALETISQLITNKKGKLTINACRIVDWPELQWRDYMLDEARHFHGAPLVKNMLDEMVRLKMNTFHWHLADDQGWRVQIDAYPLLTAKGSWGDFSKWNRTEAEWKKQNPGKERAYYTKDEIKDIVNYAAERGIKVVPEIEVPGHCHTAVNVYPELAATCDDGSYAGWDIYDVTKPEFNKFIRAVFDEIVELFPSKIVHIGGDEANYTRWKKNSLINEFMKEKGLNSYTDLQLYAINDIAEYLSSKGISIIGWNEITGDNVHDAKDFQEPTVHLKPGTLVQFWDGSPQFAKNAIGKGYDIVNSDRFYTYLDYPYEVTPLEKVYSFNPYFDGLTPEQRKHVIGTGCQMWNELTPTDARVYYQTFPRIAACAENGWTPQGNKNLTSFSKRIAPLEKRWATKGYIQDQPTYSTKSANK